jgi:hypothetical protein
MTPDELAILQADAERYRWIRFNSIVPHQGRRPIHFPIVPAVQVGTNYSERFDAAVDEARGAK